MKSCATCPHCQPEKTLGPSEKSIQVRKLYIVSQVQGVVAMSGDFCSGGVQAYTIRTTFAMMAPLRSFVEGVPHGRYYSAHPSGGPLSFGTGGRPQAQHRCPY